MSRNAFLRSVEYNAKTVCNYEMYTFKHSFFMRSNYSYLMRKNLVRHDDPIPHYWTINYTTGRSICQSFASVFLLHKYDPYPIDTLIDDNKMCKDPFA